MSMSDLYGRRPAGRYVNDFYETEYIDDDEQLHREDGPAYIDAEGNSMWYDHGKPHRAGGLPAAEYKDGRVEYWENGVQLTPEQAQAIRENIAAEKRRAEAKNTGENMARDMGAGLSHDMPVMKKITPKPKTPRPGR
ncbi:MAG: hypothetical protein GC185_09980 [Alphaproteobacteria bacterium]|nr:hypothetical protein [Alphaproteobacteria bacterium]